ncbi:MAG TPA: hypothetical protein VFN23_07530 [Ktedonobacteraceae bacterium]|nr:hypothetical protein [Ktedonobacteraceae bacterium]
MQQNQQPRQGDDKRVEALLFFVALLLAWPAFLLGAVCYHLLKRYTKGAFFYWLGAGMLGVLGAWVLWTHANPVRLLIALEHDVFPLALHFSKANAIHFVLDALPLWERSLFLFPWMILLFQAVRPKRFEMTLLGKERHKRAIQARKSARAARKAAHVPDTVNQKGVFGVLIEDLNI